jgi:serine/threonine-protein kinase
MLGTYRLGERIAADHAREAWRATDTRDDREVALTFLPHCKEAKAYASLEQVAETLRRLAHPNIVTIDALDSADGLPFACTEPPRGTSLAELVPRRGLSRDKLFAHSDSLASALCAAHDASLIHGELTPRDVRFNREGRMRIHGFGFAETASASGREPTPDEMPTITLTLDGTDPTLLTYRSPEQIQGKPLDRRTDVYAFGMLLFWMATGLRPFRGESPADVFVAIMKDTPRGVSKLVSEHPPALDAVVSRCLQKERDRRYPSMREAREALAAIVA